jgi:transcription elongation factor Elf1
METANSVIFSCPECNQEVEVRAKAAILNALNLYHEESVPKPIAETIIGNTVYCPKCGDRFTVTLDTHSATVPLFLRKG